MNWYHNSQTDPKLYVIKYSKRVTLLQADVANVSCEFCGSDSLVSETGHDVVMTV